MVNLGLAYNKRYWDTLEGQRDIEKKYTFKKIEKELTSKQLISDEGYLDWVDKSNSFVLKTTYPGLLIGTGYLHEAPDQNDAIKIGFYFDYTSGMPMIPGSSVKGVLKSYFPSTCGEISEYEQDVEKINMAKTKLISEMLGNKLSTYQDIKKLSDSIFGKSSEEEGICTQQDIFFDATIYCRGNDNKKQILGKDYITPHKNPTKNPTPISMLKILPSVEICFRFDAKDSIIQCQDGRTVKITINDKMSLFKSLLLFGGVGAKTNVGYGQFEN